MCISHLKKLLMIFMIQAVVVPISGVDFKPERTLYVSAKGSDYNDGLSGKTAFRTIAAAAETVIPGDLVLVKGGIYRESVVLEKSGTEKKPIVFRAVPGETVLVTWGWNINGWKKVDGTRFCYESSFPYALNMLWERKTLSRYLELDNLDLLDKQPGGFIFDRKTARIFVHAFDGGNPEFAGMTAIPCINGKKPEPEISRLYNSRNKGFLIKGSYNTVEGFELSFFPNGIQIRGELKGCILRNNTVYGTTTGFSTYSPIDPGKTTSEHLFENNRAYRNTGPGIIIEGNNKNIIIRNNHLFNNGPCPPFLVQDTGSNGHAYNLAQYGGNVFNVSFIDNTVISDDPSRRYGVMRCKLGGDGNMDVSQNILVGGGPYFWPKPDSNAIIKNNTIIDGDIEYKKTSSDGREYKPELKDNICLKNGDKVEPCFADPSFYDYRLPKDSPFIGKGAYPETGQVLYVNPSAKEETDGSTPGKALKTLSEAFKKATSGNCIYIAPGIYRENLSLAEIGAEKTIVIRNYGKGKVVFENSRFALRECRNISIDGIIFKDSKVHLANSNDIELIHCVFDGTECEIKAEGGRSLKIINDTFIRNLISADTGNATLILKNNLFMDCKSFPVKSETEKTISENNVFSGENAGKILFEWKNKYNEEITSFENSIKLANNYFLPDGTKLAYSGLGWTFIGACGPEKKDRPVAVEKLETANIFPDRVIFCWETPFDYPDVRIICKNKNGKTLCNIPVNQGEYKQTRRMECVKGLTPGTQYNISFIFTNPGGMDKTEKKLSVTTTEEKDFHTKTIYVSKSGNDAKSGQSPNDAKKSISGALRTTQPGDTVLVAPGIYTEQININTDGISPNKHFILKSEKAGQAIINAAYLIDTALRITQGKHITVDGFKFSGLRYSDIAIALAVYKSNNIIIKNCIFERNWKKKEGGGISNIQLICGNVKDVEVRNCIFDSGFHGIWMSDCNNVRIFNNTFWHNGISAVRVGCAENYNVAIYNNIFMDVVSNHNSPAVSTGEHSDKIICDYNIYWKTDTICPAQKFYGAGGGKYGGTWNVMKKAAPKTLEETRKMYGVEIHGQFADPMLKDPINGNFCIKPGSPAIGKGRNGLNIGANMKIFSK